MTRLERWVHVHGYVQLALYVPKCFFLFRTGDFHSLIFRCLGISATVSWRGTGGWSNRWRGECRRLRNNNPFGPLSRHVGEMDCAVLIDPAVNLARMGYGKRDNSKKQDSAHASSINLSCAMDQCIARTLMVRAMRPTPNQETWYIIKGCSTSGTQPGECSCAAKSPHRP